MIERSREGAMSNDTTDTIDNHKLAQRALPVLRDDYVRPAVCAPCGGRCCKTLPGAAMPEDFGADEATIRAVMVSRLKTGEWSIDWWEGDPRPDHYEEERGYFLRPATLGGRGDVFDPSNGGQCVLFDEGKGCRTFETRPTGCRGLEPGPAAGKCSPRYASKQDAAIAWLPYAAMIVEVGEELGAYPQDDPPAFGSLWGAW